MHTINLILVGVGKMCCRHLRTLIIPKNQIYENTPHPLTTWDSGCECKQQFSVFVMLKARAAHGVGENVDLSDNWQG